MADEVSRGSSEEDYDFDDAIDDGEDFEETIAEDELAEEDYENELRDLEDEGEMDIEELRRRYGYTAEGGVEVPGSGGANEVEAATSSAPSNNSELAAAVRNYFEDAGNSNSGDDEDTEYAPPDPWKKEIRVDEDKFQASIPELKESQETIGEHATPLWLVSGLEDEQIQNYLKDVHSLRVSFGQQFPERFNEARDDEDALAALMKNDYNVEKAKASFPFPHVNTAITSVRQDALEFDMMEEILFQEGLEEFGKNFSLIQKAKLPYRYVGELVDFYYKWKMTPRYSVWRKRNEPKSSSPEPQITMNDVVELPMSETPEAPGTP